MLINPSTYTGWIAPHSIEWYAQLGKQVGRYRYPWKSTVDEPNGETVFTEEVSKTVPGLNVLDVGCGDGGFALSWSSIVNQIVGFDITEDFLPKEGVPPNVKFVSGNLKVGMPFDEDSFDCAYNRKGPTSAYHDLLRVVRGGGQVIGLHPGDDISKELSEWYPDFFDPIPTATPILQILQDRLSSYRHADIRLISSTEYLQSPVDVILMRTFGQKAAIFEECLKSLKEITQIFERHATDKGLPITYSRYLVKAIV
ncbi:class I SAM-dependent methyltransferase [Chungangia koreensis]|uniref:Class I SAM-dependent methyltransferase n=1 Tax=Chungangia koreensis TaxID=752657 RepID=A0ABV8XCB0_9LACT